MLALAVGDVALVQSVESDASKHFPPVLWLELRQVGKGRQPASGQGFIGHRVHVHPANSFLSARGTDALPKPRYTRILPPIFGQSGVPPRHNIVTACELRVIEDCP